MKILKTTEFKLFATIFLVLVFFISHYGGSFMADSILATTQAIIDNGDVVIDQYVKEGCKNTTSKTLLGCDHAFNQDHYYSGFPPGASFIALPAYAILKPFTYFIPDEVAGFPKFQIKTLLLNILATLLIIIPLSALLAVLLYRASGHFIKDKRARILAALLLSFGSIIFYYSTTFDARVLATFFSFAAFYMLFTARLKGSKPRQLFIAGLLASVAITIEYMQVVVAVILFIYLISFLRDRRVFYFIAGGIIPVLLMLSYHNAAFDSPFSTGYDFRQGEDSWIGEKEMFSGFSLLNLWHYTFSPRYGIFFYMPVLLLCFYGLYLGFKEKREFWREWAVGGLVFLSYILIIISFVSESPCTFGPRYLIVLIPFLALPLALAIRNVGLIIASLIGAASVFVNALPVLYMVENTGCNPGLPVFSKLLGEMFHKGLTNYTFNLINQVATPLNYLLVNAASVIILGAIGVVIWLLWRR